MGETNSPSVAHVGYDISPLSRVNLFLFNSLEWRNIVTHGQLKENLYVHFAIIITYSYVGFALKICGMSYCCKAHVDSVGIYFRLHPIFVIFDLISLLLI
jgi:hypothetical protein